MPEDNHDKPRLVIFTDLDGTLLDPDTYEWEEARPAMEECRRLDIPIVLVSSKTVDEMRALRGPMKNLSPFIAENGGMVALPRSLSPSAPKGTVDKRKFWAWELGRPRMELVEALSKAAGNLKISVRGFADMTAREIGQRTGLTIWNAGLAGKREFDEPFVMEDETPLKVEALEKALTKMGLSLTRGGRFFHVMGDSDKGRAVRVLLDWYKGRGENIFSIALGDQENDRSMLEAVDRAFFVGSAQNAPNNIQHLTLCEKTGPAGWNQAVLEVLTEMRLI